MLAVVFKFLGEVRERSGTGGEVQAILKTDLLGQVGREYATFLMDGALFALPAENALEALPASKITTVSTGVLEGLQKLGYQVQEGLSTMVADSGRLIARSPVNGTYGVELVTGANQKVQVRSIAFDAARDSSQDVAEERRWCGDFGKLQAALQASGCEVVVEKALGVGATPLRVVEAVEENRRSQTSPGVVGRSR